MPPRSDGLSGASDADHMRHVVERGYVLITMDPDDFLDLHEQCIADGRHHPGILLVYRDRYHAKDMSPEQIAHSVEKLIASGIPIADGAHVLNHWRYP